MKLKILFITFSVILVACAGSLEPTEPLVAPTNILELGEKLFFDVSLSKDNSISCGSCHIPEFAFADTVKFSLGVRGQLGVRNTPSSMNMASRPYFFYDGRAATIQDQVLMPIHNPIEMDLPIPDLLERLNNNHYKEWFNSIFESDPDSSTLGAALGAFVFSLESKGDTPFDRWMGGDTTAMTQRQVEGHEIFNEKAKCFDCHFTPDFTGDEFRNIGLYNGSDTLKDAGRFVITNDSSDLGKLKVPGLRNIAVTAPYMHNGMFQTLEEVIEYYDDPTKFVQNSINMDTLVQEPLHLTQDEKDKLLEFLHSLTDSEFVSN
jgi:cytochrome c peroxidase